MNFSVWCGVVLCGVGVGVVWCKRGGGVGRRHWDNESSSKVLNVDKIKSLGWEPKISLKDGIKSTYDWYRTRK